LQNGNSTSEYEKGLADGEIIGGDFIQGERSVNSRRPDAELEEESNYGITERIKDFKLRLSP
jgi:hypothetical protein